jgi:hypothetical protein
MQDRLFPGEFHSLERGTPPTSMKTRLSSYGRDTLAELWKRERSMALTMMVEEFRRNCRPTPNLPAEKSSPEANTAGPRAGLGAQSQSQCYNALRDRSHEHAMAQIHKQALVGTWTKATTAACADKYPDRLTFSAGTYRGTRGPAQGMVWWDAGIYRLEGPKTLVVATATDELVSYRIALQADRFEVTDSEGCVVTYRRV